MAQERSKTSLYLAFYSVLFGTIFNYTLSLMASPYIVADLGGSNDIATYTITFYSLGNALGIPLGKVFLGRLSRRAILTIFLILFAFFSWACGMATTYFFFNFFRFMQGFTSGPFYVVIFTLFSYLLPLEKRGRMRAIILTIFSLGSVIGASWGGFVTYEWHWRWVFYLNVPFLLSLAGFFWFRLKEFDFEKIEKKPFDGIGYLIFFIGVFSLSSALIMGQQLDWFRSNTVITLVSIAVILIPFFILWELYHSNPIVPIRLLKNPVLSFSLFHLGVLYAAYFGMIVLLSLWLKLYVNYTPDWIAVIIGTMAIASVFPWFLIERKWDEYDCRICLGIAILILAISCFYTTHFNVEINFGRVAYSRILAGVGLALFLMPLFRLCIFTYKADAERTSAFGMLHLTRALGSGLGAGLFATMWQRRQVFYHDRLGANLTAFSQETKTFFTKAQQVQQMGLTAKEQLEFYLQQQATALALDDCFYMMGWMLIGLLCTFAITIFFKKGAFSGRTKPLI